VLLPYRIAIWYGFCAGFVARIPFFFIPLDGPLGLSHQFSGMITFGIAAGVAGYLGRSAGWLHGLGTTLLMFFVPLLFGVVLSLFRPGLLPVFLRATVSAPLSTVFILLAYGSFSMFWAQLMKGLRADGWKGWGGMIERWRSASSLSPVGTNAIGVLMATGAFLPLFVLGSASSSSPTSASVWLLSSIGLVCAGFLAGLLGTVPGFLLGACAAVYVFALMLTAKLSNPPFQMPNLPSPRAWIISVFVGLFVGGLAGLAGARVRSKAVP